MVKQRETESFLDRLFINGWERHREVSAEIRNELKDWNVGIVGITYRVCHH
jgi:hypothetical protein